jgi:hypothetical protein
VKFLKNQLLWCLSLDKFFGDQTRKNHQGEMTQMAKHHSSPDFSRLPNFPKTFQSKYLIGKRKTRIRKFTPRILFRTLLELVAGTNRDGYVTALLKSFDFTKKKRFGVPPSKGSLSKVRARISYKFFRDFFFKLISQFEPDRLTFRGLRIYAIDGFEVSLPRTKEILKRHFRGRALSDHREMYYPRMYLGHCYDVLSGVTKDLKFHHLLDEITDAEEMVPALEANSLTLYDRLYFCGRLIQAHKSAGNYFLTRCKRGGFLEVQKFFESPKKRATVEIGGVVIHLIKMKPPGAEDTLVFATNLLLSWVEEQLILRLYGLRWEVEVSFKDLLETMKLEQWHSKSLNGVLQEIYAAFWLLNYTKIQIAKNNPKPLEVLEIDYFKPNFKVILTFIVGLLPKLFQRIQGLLSKLPLLMKLCTERRKRHSRHYKRELKCSASPYSYNNTVWVHDS